MMRKNILLSKFLSLGWISCIGDALYYLALMTYAATLENPALGILVITISTTLPNLIGLLLGTVADSVKNKIKRITQAGIFRGIIFIAIGLIINQTTDLWGLLLIGLLNALSDTAGSFSAFLKSPFLRLASKEEELEQWVGLDQSVRGAIDGIAGFFGVLLLGILGVYYLAFFNAFLFFTVSLGFQLLAKKFKPIEGQMAPSTLTSTKDFTSHLLQSVKTLLTIKTLRNFLLVAAAANALLASAVPVILMAFTHHPNQLLYNFELSITVGKAGILAVAIAAGLVGPKYCKNIGTTATLLMAMGGMLSFAVVLSLGQVWLAFGTLFLSVFAATMFSVRFSSLLMKSVPVETLGSISGGVSLFSRVLPIPVTLVLNSLAAVSLQLYGIAAAVLAVGIALLILILKFDKMDLTETVTNLKMLSR